MTKADLKIADNSAVIMDAIRTFGFLLRNEALDRGTKQLEKHFQDCCKELNARELLTTQDWDNLNK